MHNREAIKIGTKKQKRYMNDKNNASKNQFSNNK